jgi:hypothetical protein
MSTRTQLLEDAIVALIQAKIPTGAEIAPMPETKAEYERVTDTPKIWVMLNSVDGGDEVSSGYLNQRCTYIFQVTLKASRLRNDLGIYNLKDLIERATLGKRPGSGAGKMTLMKFQHNGEESGVFDYSLFLRCPGIMHVEDIDTDTDEEFGQGAGANLTQNTYTQTVGQ